jgi:3-oxoadipate enol-lactonase
MGLFIPVAGGQVWAQDTGGPGTPVILANSDWCDSTSWDRTIDRLPGSCRVIRYDSPGYGRSPAPTNPFTQLGDLIAVVDYLQVGQSVVAGHSGGGGTAIGLALARPDQVSALILAAPGCQDYPWPEDDPYMSEFSRLYAAGDRAGLVALGLRTMTSAGGTSAGGTSAGGTSADPVAEAVVRGAVEAFFRQGDYLCPDPPAWPRLGEISVPTVMVIGELDYPMIRDCGAAIAGRIAHCRTVVVPGADHLLPMSAPAVLAAEIMQHLPSEDPSG